MTTKKKIERVKELQNAAPNGIIIDADTILADFVEEADFEVSGLSNELFEIYEKSRDKECFKRMFEVFTESTFDEYLSSCIKRITREHVELVKRTMEGENDEGKCSN